MAGNPALDGPKAVFENDGIMPCQLLDRSRIRRPEHRLCLAVLEDAVLVILRNPTRGEVLGAGKKVFRDALEWLKSTEDYPFSFEMVCDVLGCGAEWLRKGVLGRLERGEGMAHHMKGPKVLAIPRPPNMAPTRYETRVFDRQEVYQQKVMRYVRAAEMRGEQASRRDMLRRLWWSGTASMMNKAIEQLGLEGRIGR